MTPASSPARTTSLSVVIGTCNRRELLRECLGSLIGKIAGPHEIIVVDAGSTDGTLEYLRTVAGIRVVADAERLGQAQSLNRVFRHLGSDLICWLSDDNVLQPGMLDAAVGVLDAHADIGMVALKTKDVRGPFTQHPYIGGLSPGARVLTANQGVIRRELFQSLGFFAEEYRDYGIDMELTMQVLLGGWKVVMTRAVAIHHFRDHEAHPGAITSTARKERHAAARQKYFERYADLAPPTVVSRLCDTLLRLGKRLGLFRAGCSFLGYNERDWTNLLRGRFISKLDFFQTRSQPFYLVQHLPSRLTHSRRSPVQTQLQPS
jgi:GT2 family glycosyltransferase